ncbi:PBS lyase HEAT-like repeat domain protein [Coleofasciculus chthonoplastes PCC 7420]|uniref:PBS lyase HEAT-like repeat domain protein n=1 Tax=Coleofasciculus chthonoplastes PCC 7420 TaxID=118168 RepID=B4VU47_9CYAN|nr:HEAT repeat domain-containing protein [Coleofasciculus chthonoplastes]EDX74568.1 PBS lyase HEAT-like repeat domain protein [Coleofasciculus chthonoplastes PCC 7420]
MVQDYSIEFTDYLRSICDLYKQWWKLDKLTDTIYEQQDASGNPRSPFQFNLTVQRLKPPPQEGNETPETLPILTGLRQYAANHVLLVGQPGSGKSTALIQFLVEQAKQALSHPQNPIPVLVQLRQFKPSETHHSGVLYLIQDFLEIHELLLEISDIKNLLRNRRLFLLLDGLNELPSNSARRDLKAFRQKYSHLPMIFTTRNLGEGWDLGIRDHLEIEPLNPLQIKQFIHYSMIGQNKQPLQQLSNHWRELGQTPFVMEMLSFLVQKTGHIPSSLAETLRQFTQLYERGYKEDAPISDESRRWWSRLLEKLAFEMMQEDNSTDFKLNISHRKVKSIFTEFLQGKVNYPDDLAIRCLDDLLKHHLIVRSQRFSASGTKVPTTNLVSSERFSASGTEVPTTNLVSSERFSASGTEVPTTNLVSSERFSASGTEVPTTNLVSSERFSASGTEVPTTNLVSSERFSASGTEVPTTNLVSNERFSASGTKVPTTNVEFSHQLIQEYYAAEYLLSWQKILELNDNQLKQDYLNYLKWTEPLALMLALVDNKAQAVRMVRLALEVDLRLGARFAGAVKPEFQEKTVGLVAQLTVTEALKTHLLGITRSEWAIEALIHNLSSEEYYIRWSAVNGLGKIGSESVIDALEPALTAQDKGIRWTVVKVLGTIGTEKAIAQLRQLAFDKYCSQYVVELLGDSGTESAIELLGEVLFSQDSSIHWCAVEALAKIGTESAINLLQKALLYGESDLSYNAVYALAKIDTKLAIEVLTQALEHEQESVRFRAALALVKKSNEAVIPVLCQILANFDDEIAYQAVNSLLSIGTEATIPGLHQALFHPNDSIPMRALEGLVDIGTAATIPALSDALRDRDLAGCLSQRITEVLKEIGTSDAIAVLKQALFSDNYCIHEYAAEALGTIGSEETIKILIEALSHPKHSVRCSVVNVLGNIGCKSAIPELIEALQDKESSVRSRAAKALETIADSEAVTALIQALHDEESFVRCRVAEALGIIGAPEAVSALVDVWQDQSVSVSSIVAEALGKIGTTEAIKALRQALLNDNKFIRWDAAKVLQEIGGSELLPDLSKMLAKTTCDRTPDILDVIYAIQDRYQFYNQSVAESPLSVPDQSGDPLIDSLETIIQILKTMSNNPTNNFKGATFNGITGTVTGNIVGDNIGSQNNYPAEQRQTLTEAAAEIQQLLAQLKNSNPTLTESERQSVVIEAINQEIKRNPTFKQRLQSALKAGGIEALKSLFPAVNIPIETIKGWMEAES